MMELIIIKTNNSQELKKLLQEKHINYEVYQPKEKKVITIVSIVVSFFTFLGASALMQ